MPSRRTASWARSAGGHLLRYRSQPDGREALRRGGRPHREGSRHRGVPDAEPSFGCKRPIIDQGYYETFNRDNVTLVDLRNGPIVEITADGIRTEQGIHELDVIIYATGFDAMTGALTRINVHGRDGMLLADFWASEGPLYLSRDRGRRVPESVHRAGAGKPCGGNEFRRRAGTARGVDRRLHRVSARQRLPHHRGAARCAARMDRAHHSARRADRAGPSDRATPGTTAATFPARNGCTWATRRGFRSTAGDATRSPTRATPDSSSA